MSYMRTVKQENPFVQMDKYFIEDDKLSFEAKGLLAYVLSKPNTWQIRKNDLIKKSQSGRTRIESALLELMAAGYLNWYQTREEGGTFGDWVYDVYERPEFNPKAEECIKEGESRIQRRKDDNKAKNKQKKAAKTEETAPKADNLPSESPKAGYPKADNPKADNLPYSNNDFSDIELSNNDLSKEEEEADSILLSMFQKNIAANAGDSIKDEFTKWLTVLPFDVIANELQYAAKRNATSFSYIEKALLQDQQQGVDTIEKLQSKRAQYAASKKKPVKATKQHVRQEKLPEWFTDKEKGQSAVKELTEGEKSSLELEKAQMLEKLALKKQKR